MALVEQLAMTMYLPLNDPRAGTCGARVYRELLRTQWCSAEELGRLQESKLKALMDHARSTVPFFDDYPPWIRDGPGSLRERMADYPILTKESIRADPSKMHPRAGLPRTFTKATTGGTTGEPLEIWYGRGRRVMVLAASWRGRSWLGIKPWTKGVNVRAFGRGSWYGRLRMRLTNRWLFDVFGKSAEDRARVAAALSRIEPTYLEGFVSEAMALGEACFAAGVHIDQILTTGEMLYEHQRRELARLFGASVSDYYGCNEVGAIAFECERRKKHITDEHVVLEVVDSNDQPVWDTPGRILLTDLDNFLTPLIRYEVGDIGVITRSPCRCGRGLTVLREIDGRTHDAIRNASGGKLSALFFAGRFKGSKIIHRVQIVQRSLGEVELLWEGPVGEIADQLKAITDEIRSRLGSEMMVKSKRVDELIYTGRGKRRLIIGLEEQSRFPLTDASGGRMDSST